MNYQLHPAAASEHLDSIAFYESRLAGLGASYMAEFEATMNKVCASPPKSFPIDCPPDIRKTLTAHKFPIDHDWKGRDTSQNGVDFPIP